MQQISVKSLEECSSYDGDVDNDSFKSAVCEMYGGFRHTVPTEIFASQTFNDEALCVSSGSDMVYTPDSDLIIYTSDEGTVDDVSFDGLISLDDECNLDYGESSDGNLSYDTDISLGECTEEEDIIPSLIKERSIKLKKLDKTPQTQTENFNIPMNVKPSDMDHIYNEVTNVPNIHLKDVISNIKELKLNGVPHLGSTYVSENDTSFLSLDSLNLLRS